MATPAKDISQEDSEDTQDQDLISDPLQEEQEENQDPIPDPQSGPTDQFVPTPEYVTLLEQQLREQNQQIQTLINRETVPTPAPTPPPRDPDAERARFYEDPMESTRELIRSELNQAVAPLTEFVKEFKQTNAYDTLKQSFKNNVVNRQLAQYLDDPDVVTAVDQIMSKAEKTEQNLGAAIVHVLGLRAAGVLQGVQTSPTPAPQPQPTPQPGVPMRATPPHMRPSGSPTPRGGTPAARRELNELERRLARERWPNLTVAEQKERYLNFLEATPNRVVDLGEDGKVKAS